MQNAAIVRFRKHSYSPATLLGVLLLSLAWTQQVSAAVVINELMPKNDDEWVEFYNTGDASVSMDRWTIENVSGQTKTYTLNASANIGGHGFYVVHKSQSGIHFSADGDAIRLKDEKGDLVDLQGFPGILGYNTAWGRAPDGTGLMTGCTHPTPEAKNDCPVPTPTPTPTPAPPTETPAVTAAAPAPVAQTGEVESQFTNFPSDESIPRIIHTPTSTPTPTLSPDLIKIEIPNSLILSKTVLIQAAIVLGAWILLAAVAYLNKKKRKPVKKHTPPTPHSPS